MMVKTKMTSSGIKIPNILLLCPFLLSLGVSADTVKRSIYLGDANEFVSDIATRGDGSLVFVTCIPLNEETGLECVIHVIGLSGPEITYPVSYKDFKPNPFIRVEVSFDMIRDMVFVLLRERFPTSRHTTLFAVDLTSGNVSISDYSQDTADRDYDISVISDYNGTNVIFKDPSVCGNHIPPCKLTFNRRGEYLSGPVSFPIEDGYLKIFPRVVKSADKGILVFQGTFPPFSQVPAKPFEVTGIYIDPSGHTTILHRFPNFPTIFFDTSDLYVACAYSDDWLIEINCMQYDWKLDETIEFTLLPTHFGMWNESNFIASVASLTKSKFLIAYLLIPKEGSYLHHRTIEVSSINSDGKVFKTMQLFHDLDIPDALSLKQPAIVEVDDQFCFYVIYYVDAADKSDNFRKFLNVHTRCIPKSDFF